MQTKLEKYKELLFNNYEELKKLAKKQFPKSDTDADAAINFVLEKISENNWKRLLACDERKFTSCLKKIVYNLLVDYHRKVSKRYQTPKWVKERGPLFVEIHRCLHYKRMSREEIKERIDIFLSEIQDIPKYKHHLLIDYHRKDSKRYRTPKWVKEREPLFVEIYRCLYYNRMSREEIKDRIDIILSEIQGKFINNAPDDFEDIGPEKLKRDKIIKLVGEAIVGEEYDHDNKPYFLSKEILKKLHKFRSILELTTKDRLFLRMINEKNEKITKAGKIVYDLTKRGAYSKKEKLQNHILEAMNKAQLGPEIQELLKKI